MEDIIGKTVADFMPEESARLVAEMEAEVFGTRKAVLNREVELVQADGTKRWFLSTRVPLRDEVGGVQSLLCIDRDITDRKKSEQRLVALNADLFAALADLKNAHEELRSVQLQLIEAEKMKSIGRLAAGVAHEVKNPLAVIRMGIDFFSQNVVGKDPLAGEVLEEMLQSIARADEVIKGLLDYSAPRDLELAESGLNEIVEHALTLVRGEISSEKFKIELDLAKDLPPVNVDALKISQVLVNLMLNAIHAMEDGGTLGVRTRIEQVTGVGPNISDKRSEIFRPGDHMAVIEIEDTGHGIDPSKLEMIFEPFFTTKPTGKGTGLGLTVVKSIIDLHGGFVEAMNRPEGGARITISLKVNK
jgi:signal transduction histidine kinase